MTSLCISSVVAVSTSQPDHSETQAPAGISGDQPPIPPTSATPLVFSSILPLSTRHIATIVTPASPSTLKMSLLSISSIVAISASCAAQSETQATMASSGPQSPTPLPLRAPSTSPSILLSPTPRIATFATAASPSAVIALFYISSVVALLILHTPRSDAQVTTVTSGLPPPRPPTTSTPPTSASLLIPPSPHIPPITTMASPFAPQFSQTGSP